MHPGDSIAVFTTAERCDFFRAAFGEDIDMCVNPYESVPLDLTLENLRVGGGTLIVLDENHFLKPEQMLNGLKSYLDKPRNKGRLMRVIVVCSGRQPGDELLSYLVSYLGIYDIVCAKSGADMVPELARLLTEPNARVDVLDLFAPQERPRPRLEETIDVREPSLSGEFTNGGFKIQVQLCVQPMEAT